MKKLLLLILLSLSAQAEVAKKLSPYPVVFVHGIANGIKNWQPIAQRISTGAVYTAGFNAGGQIETNVDADKVPSQRIWLLSYYRPKPISESLKGDLTLYSERLSKLVDLVKRKTSSDKVIIVAHSMGGLVSRFYMSSNQSNWDSVHRILTVGTPHRGVIVSVPVVGQLQDLAVNSNFINQLDLQWASFSNAKQKWGVVGAVSFLNGPIPVTGLSTDFAGPGFVSLYSAIPFGEWEQALEIPGQPSLNTANFGYRLFLHSGHRELLEHDQVVAAIQWARQY